jgi:hypothetical protein
VYSLCPAGVSFLRHIAAHHSEEDTSHHATLPLYQELVKISFLPFLSPKADQHKIDWG